MRLTIHSHGHKIEITARDRALGDIRAIRADGQEIFSAGWLGSGADDVTFTLYENDVPVRYTLHNEWDMGIWPEGHYLELRREGELLLTIP